MNILEPSNGREPEYLYPGKDLIFKFNKVVDNDGDKIAYKLTQDQLEQSIDFNTFYFDDFVQMSVYHKNSTASAHLIGKEKLHFREIAFGTVYPLTLSEEGHKIGTVFLTAEYWPIDHKLIDTMWT
jgi:hypothetical protein